MSRQLNAAVRVTDCGVTGWDMKTIRQHTLALWQAVHSVRGWAGGRAPKTVTAHHTICVCHSDRPETMYMSDALKVFTRLISFL